MNNVITSIKNMSSQLNEGGKIKIGVKGRTSTSSNGKEFKLPEKLDHIILTTTEKGAEGDFIHDTVLMDSLKLDKTLINSAGNLVRIPIRLLYNSIDLNFPTRYQSYNGGRLSCYGDGEISYKRLKSFAEPTRCPCSRVEPGYNGADKCKPTGTLSCIIDNADLFGQTHTFRTTSANSIKGIIGGMQLIQMATNGRLAGIPLILALNQKNTVTPDGMKTAVYVMSICYRGTMDGLRGNVIKLLGEEKQYLLNMAQIEKTARENGVGGSALSQEEEVEFAEEFFPDSVNTNLKRQGSGHVPVSEVTSDNSISIDFELTPEPISEPISKQEEAETKAELQAPTGPYLKIYESLVGEKDYDKARGYLARLKKHDILYWLATDHQHYADETLLKPALIEIGNKILDEIFAQPPEFSFDESENKVYCGVDTSEFSEKTATFLKSLHRASAQIDAANLCTDYFKPVPIDRTQTKDDLIRMSVEKIASEKNIPVSNSKHPFKTQQLASNEFPGDTLKDDPAPTPIPANTEPTIIIAPPSAPVRAWDESGEIKEHQKLTILVLKKALQEKGLIKPEKWSIHVGYFLDSSGNPHSTAKNMSETQAETFINMLRESLSGNEDVPF